MRLCRGEVFSSPTPDQIAAAAQAVADAPGVLFIVKNYSGDVMNFEMAMELNGGAQRRVLVEDDVAVEASTIRSVAGSRRYLGSRKIRQARPPSPGPILRDAR